MVYLFECLHGGSSTTLSMHQQVERSFESLPVENACCVLLQLFQKFKSQEVLLRAPPVVVNLPPPMQGTHIHTKLNVQGRRMPGGGEDGMHR